MKKALKFASLCAGLLAIAAFVLLIATESLTHTYTALSVSFHDLYSAPAVLFGNGNMVIANVSANFEGTLAWNALVAWILTGAAGILSLVSFIGSSVKAKKVLKFSGLISLLSAGLLIAAGILLFFTKSVFYNANGWGNINDAYNLSATWIIAGIASILGGLISALPSVFAIVGKK